MEVGAVSVEWVRVRGQSLFDLSGTEPGHLSGRSSVLLGRMWNLKCLDTC